MKLSNTRAEGFNGALPITYLEIKSFFELIKVEPLEWEISLIKRFDVAYLNHYRSKKE